ncbi:hypothetical protein MANES_01G083275v8 [Manihot esculenta]|uniref:non-specific serine/threonine protein kinase n=1 Tax=Manihot esculenta TaxID=3983 RepID=A0A2C9WM61_MANES|nr:hypothetical protein MANES_01G083275v8 [Manihot esculenta]
MGLTRAQDEEIWRYESLAIPIGIKLDGTNYGLWSQIMEITYNAIVRSWLINSMDPKLISNYIRYPTIKAVWDVVATTYFDGQTHHRSMTERSIETYYNNLQGLWRETDFRRPNPMRCESNIKKFYFIVQEDSDVLQIQPFPIVEQTYALVRLEDLRLSVMLANDNNIHGVVITSKGQKSQHQHPFQRVPNEKLTTQLKQKSQAEGGGCTHSKKKKDVGQPVFVNIGDSSFGASTELQLSLIPQNESTQATTNKTMALNDTCNQSWIIDSGATDHMTFYSQDLITTS